MKRELCQLPQLQMGGEEGERHPTWLELFYDLVFVVAVAAVGNRIGRDVSASSVLGFAALFVPVWWSWIGTTVYADRFDSDSVAQRLAIGVQMFAVAALAVNVRNGLGSGAAGFALAYVAIRTVLIFLYMAAGRDIPAARPLTRHYSVGFSVAAAIWLVSALTPAPARFALWVVALAVDLGTPLSARHAQAKVPVNTSHLAERFGLFILIVLGESVAAVVSGLTRQTWQLSSFIAAAFGLAIAFSLWWVYFDNLESSVFRRRWIVAQLWFYMHLPLVMGLTATGVGVRLLVSHPQATTLSDGERWLICGAVALSLMTIGIIQASAAGKLTGEARFGYRCGAALAALLLAAAGYHLFPVVIIGILALLCAVQVPVDLFAGARQEREARQIAM